MERDRKKTPAELQAIKDEMARLKAVSKRKQDIKNVKVGRIIMFVLAGVMVLSAFLEYKMLNERIEVFYIYAPIFLCYLLFGIFYYKNPFVIPIIGLVIYSLLVLISASGNPEAFSKSIGIKILIIAGLVRAIKYGKDYQVAKSYTGDTLDQGLFDETK